MDCQAEVSLYPLRTPTMTETILPFVEHLRQAGLAVELGALSTTVRGPAEAMFRALGEALEQAGRERDVVLIVKASNTYPR